MGAKTSKGATKAFPDSAMLYLLAACHIRNGETVEAARSFLDKGTQNFETLRVSSEVLEILEKAIEEL